jgi:nucleotide-binding universal stress UspA family protein
MYRRILVPIDGSRTAARGLREAARLAKDQRARVRLVHIVDETMVLGLGEAGIDLRPALAGLARSGRALLERTRRQAKKLGIAAETAFYESIARRPADAILREARRWRADLIVMGTHGRRGVGRVVLGSDAEAVLHETPVPVLMVRAPGKRRR